MKVELCPDVSVQPEKNKLHEQLQDTWHILTYKIRKISWWKIHFLLDSFSTVTQLCPQFSVAPSTDCSVQNKDPHTNKSLQESRLSFSRGALDFYFTSE